MPLLYADTSALVRAYFVDEDDHLILNRMLLVGDDPVVTSELSRVEFASAVSAAHRAHRLDDPGAMLSDFEANCAEGGEIALVGLDPGTILPLARQLVADHPLRSLDAIHLATALIDGVQSAKGEEVGMVTRDARQAAAAKACGLRVL